MEVIKDREARRIPGRALSGRPSDTPDEVDRSPIWGSGVVANPPSHPTKQTRTPRRVYTVRAPCTCPARRAANFGAFAHRDLGVGWGELVPGF